MPAWSTVLRAAHPMRSNVSHRMRLAVGGLRHKTTLDFRTWKEDPAAVLQNARRRNVRLDLDLVLARHDAFTDLEYQSRQLRARRNEITADIKSAHQAGDDAVKQALAEEAKSLRSRLADVEAERDATYLELMQEALHVPNHTHPAVPDEEPTVLQVVGSKPVFDFEPRDHIALGEMHELFDFEAGARTTGTSFYYLKNAAAALEMALIQLALNRMMLAGYMPVSPPDVVRESLVAGCGFQPRDEASQVYELASKHASGAGTLCLAGTAEIPLAGLNMQRTFAAEELPLNMVAFGRAFRCEAGSHGTATRGLYRVHQFSKVELFSIMPNDEALSNAMHEKILADQVQLFTDLGLHFEVLDMPAHDLGAPAYRKFDIEAWMPGRASYGEISSTSNCLDYQSRRLEIRCKTADGTSSGFAHTLNGTACAIPRLLIALLETHQQADGRIPMPAVLHPFLPPQYHVLVPKQPKQPTAA